MKKEEEEGGYFMPEEILREILLRLPVKSLLRFRSVDKKLCNLISSQQFISDHLKTFKCRKDLLHLNHWWSTDHTPCRYVDGVHPQDLPGPNGEKVRVVDYCNGVVCLIQKRRETYDMMLWNPSISRTVAIPTFPRSMYPRINFHSPFGFGYVDDDYKLVALPRTYSKRTQLKASVFSLKTGIWANVTCSLTDHEQAVIISPHSVFVNGACHWLATNERHERFVLSFDLNQEVFGKIVVPNYLGPRGEVSDDNIVSVFIHEGCLSLIATIFYQKNNFIAWAMKEYGVVESWTRVIETVNLRGVGAVVGFRGGGEVVYISSHAKELICYDPITKKSQRLKANHNVLLHCRLHVYRESLVLLNPRLTNGGEPPTESRLS